jgi:hypothetical protein
VPLAVIERDRIFHISIGPAGEVYREAGKVAEQRHDEIGRLRALRKAERLGGLEVYDHLKFCRKLNG